MKTNATTPIPQGYKATPLGIIPQEWEVKPLEEIGNLLSGLTYSPSNIRSNGLLVLRSSNIQEGRLVFEDNVFVDALSYTPVKEGDILICVRNGSQNLIGKTAMITKKAEGCAFGAFMAIFRSPINQYIFYLFGTEIYRKYIYRNLGATINSINGSDLRRFRFPFPPLAEQKKIAEVLGVWDKAIEKQSQLIEQLTLRKRGLMQQLLTAKRRLPGFSEPWKKVRLKEILIEGSKIPVDSTSRYKKISIGLYKKGISYVDDNKVKADIRPFYVREKGEIIIGKQNYFNGSIAIVNDKFDGTICSNAIMSFRVKNLFNLKFIYEAISEPDYLKKREMMANGTGQKELSEKDFLNFDIVVPSFEEQTAIAEVLTAADREIELAQQKLELLRQQKRGLMQQLLTGKKRVKL